MYYVIKIWGFLTPPLPPLWLRNTWMFPKKRWWNNWYFIIIKKIQINSEFFSKMMKSHQTVSNQDQNSKWEDHFQKIKSIKKLNKLVMRKWLLIYLIRTWILKMVSIYYFFIQWASVIGIDMSIHFTNWYKIYISIMRMIK